MNRDTERYLAALFSPKECVSTFGPHPGTLVYKGPWAALTPAEYITLNPIIDHRRASYMADYRNFLLEFDNVSLPQQQALLGRLETLIPIRTIVYGGNKSYHAIVALADALITGRDGEMKALLYKDYFKKLRAAVTAYLTPLVEGPLQGALIDPACSDASRLTRLPGTMNRHWKTPERQPTQQTLLSLGGLISSHEFETFVANYAPAEHFNTAHKHEPVYNGDFERTLNNQSHLWGLRNVLQVPEKWGGPNGNHPHVYRYTMWAIDTTGVSEPEFLEYIKRYTAPYLLSLGYEMWRIEEAVAGAYKIKRNRR